MGRVNLPVTGIVDAVVLLTQPMVGVSVEFCTGYWLEIRYLQ